MKTTHGPPLIDPTDRDGTVVDYYDWWILVQMKRSGVVMPFLEGELTHVVGCDGASADGAPGVSA